MSGRWLAGKVGAAAVTLVFVLIFNFFLFRVMGDPTTQFVRIPQASPEEIEQLKKDYGLDKPLLSGQLVDYMGDTARLDLGISQTTRREVWTEIKDALPHVKILMLTISDDEADLYEAIKAGASGYLLKEIPIEEVADAIRSVWAGQSRISPSMSH